MGFFINFLVGLFIGIGGIIPGVSGSAIAVIFGIYDRLTNLIAHFIKNIKKDFFFFLPIALGAGVGFLVFSKVMQYLFANYDAQVKYLFIGLIAGTFPLVLKQANKNGFKKMYILPMLISFALTILLTSLGGHPSNSLSGGQPGFILLLMSGVILGFGTIVPGISTAFLMMYLGTYEILLKGVADLDIAALFPAGIGFVLSIVLFARFISLLFQRVYGYTYYTILGFVIGSMIPIFPGFEFNTHYLICFILLIVGFFAAFALSKVKI